MSFVVSIKRFIFSRAINQNLNKNIEGNTEKIKSFLPASFLTSVLIRLIFSLPADSFLLTGFRKMSFLLLGPYCSASCGFYELNPILHDSPRSMRSWAPYVRSSGAKQQHTYGCPHTHAHTHTSPHLRTHTHTHAHTRAHTHSHSHTHTHAQGGGEVKPGSLS